MLLIDGIFLFEVFVSSTLHELFTQKHLSLPLRNSNLDKRYQFKWLKICTFMIPYSNGVRNISSILELVDFCILLFVNFAPNRRRVYRNKNLRPRAFGYSVKSDMESGFSTRRFLKILKAMTSINENMKALRDDMIDLIEHVEYIRERRMCESGKMIVAFFDWKRFRHLWAYTSIQYEFIQREPDRRTISIHANETTPKKILRYEISTK
ncbi:hypothetical protein [Drosophila suzukii associated hytrosavirus 1]|nr:hypothetical protein [Drosophila suzukii associated hytrosavirus 1]